MTDKIQVYKGKVKHKGLLSFKDLYEFMYDYLIDENYDPYEDKYLDKRLRDSKEVEIDWRAEKPISDYFRFVINTNWLILGMKEVEVLKEGKKVTMDSGYLELSLNAVLIKDPDNKWKGFWKFLRYLYDNYIIRKRIEKYEELLIEEINEYIDFIKSLLAIEPRHALRRETMA